MNPRMIKKTFAAAALAAGALLALAPGAGAELPPEYSDRTADFVPFDSPAALDAAKNGKLLIISPYGTSRMIACKGEGMDVYDCAQDDDFGGIWLKPIDTPLGKAWTSF